MCTLIKRLSEYSNRLLISLKTFTIIWYFNITTAIIIVQLPEVDVYIRTAHTKYTYVLLGYFNFLYPYSMCVIISFHY